MLNNKIKLIAKIDPLKFLLSKLALTGRMVKWVMFLSKFDIEYVNQKSIKGQVMEDHLTKDESILSLDESPELKLYFGGSFTNHGSRTGILFITP
eukprot:Gb_12984 [translate_table: standard]